MIKITSLPIIKPTILILQILFFVLITSNSLVSADDNQKFIRNEILTQEISDEIMSPYCPGRTLAACPSDDARKLRLRIKGQLNQGYTIDAVKRQLIGIYGKEILGKPSFNGFGLIAWFLPFLVLMLIILLVFILIRRNYKKKKSERIIESDLNQIEKSLYLKIKK